MLVQYNGLYVARPSRWRALLYLTFMTALMAGCIEEPRPRSYMEFMEDSFAREGTLARCNQDREGTVGEADCISARRAASTVAARADEALRKQRESKSETLRAAASERAARNDNTIRQAVAAAEAAAEAEYEAQWTAPQESAQATQPIGEAVSGQAVYNSLGSTLEAVSPAPQPDDTRPVESSTPSLDFVELPPSASLVLPFVELPANAKRRVLEPEPALNEIAVPNSDRFLE